MECLFTPGHAWIRFAGKYAYAGISLYKAAQAKKIKKLVMFKVYGLKQKGELFARFQLDFQTLELFMPVAGQIIQINTMERLVRDQLLLSDPEGEGWIIKLLPQSSPADNTLFTAAKYHHLYPTPTPSL